MKIVCIICSFVLIINLSCNSEKQMLEKVKINIFAAASTGPALREIKKKISNKFNISLSVAASSTVARQVKNGANCDFVLLADKEWMDYLQRSNMIINNSRIDLLSNSLVLIAHVDKTFLLQEGLFSLSKSISGKIALADPNFVPSGRYAKKILNSLGLFKEIKKKLLLAPDVRAALLWVERKEVDAGIVYSTDAKFSKKIKIIANIPNLLTVPILYPFAKCKNFNNPYNSLSVNKFLIIFHNIGKKIFVKHGFKYLNEKI